MATQENNGCLICEYFSCDNDDPKCGKNVKEFMIQLMAGDTIECNDYGEKT